MVVNTKKTMVTKSIARNIPFSVDKKPLNKKVISYDGNVGVHYRSYDPISDFDSKVLHILSKMALDASVPKQNEELVQFIKLHEKYDETPFWGVSVLLPGFASYINPQHKGNKQYRKRIYESLLRLAGVQLQMYTDMLDYGEFEIQTGAMAWINGVSLCNPKDEYIETDLLISYDLLKSLTNGVTFNMQHSLQFKGRAYYLYLFMQSYRYDTGKGKYGYQHYIPHDEIINALTLGLMVPKEQNRIIKKAFKDIELNYTSYLTMDKKRVWKKGKTKSKVG